MYTNKTIRHKHETFNKEILYFLKIKFVKIKLLRNKNENLVLRKKIKKGTEKF